jgi:hypothetical protein
VKELYIVTKGILLGEGAVYCDRRRNGRNITGRRMGAVFCDKLDITG